MRAVVQRVKQAGVSIDGQEIASIGNGLLVLLGVHRDDQRQDVRWLADKIVNLRIFADEQGRMNRSLLDVGGAMLVVSQFTLYGDCRRGRRPSWGEAAGPAEAESLYDLFVRQVSDSGIPTRQGVFQAMMEVSLINSGPVTLLLDSHKNF